MSSELSTRDIVTIAILSALGGALSTFVGYLGNLINLALGVPFGAGQFLAGLHVFWLVLVRVLVPRNGVGTVGGLLKGLVELFMGSTHGIVIVLVSLVQGILIDIGAAFSKDSTTNSDLGSRFIWWVSAGISSGSNVVAFQLLYFSGVPPVYIGVITILAFSSGVIFAGYFAWETLEFLNETQLVTHSSLGSQTSSPSGSGLRRRNLPAIAFLLFLVVGSAYYSVFVAEIFTDINSCRVTGLVENTYTYHPSLFEGQEVTIEAELKGTYETLQPANYTGIPLSVIIGESIPSPNATAVRVSARDGYFIIFDLHSVINDPRMILTETENGLWLIAGDYVGSQWVRMVSTIEIY